MKIVLTNSEAENRRMCHSVMNGKYEGKETSKSLGVGKLKDYKQ